MLWTDRNRFGWGWDPWREFENMNRALWRWPSETSVDFPAVNVWTNDETAVVTTELPGIDPGDIDISVEGRVLTLKGERKREETAEGDTFHRRERWHGKFTKSIRLPFNVEARSIDARFAKGVLTITLPQAEAEKPRKITVKTG